MAKVVATPGVFVEEVNSLSRSILPVPTAVPAFIGYTQMAVRNNQDLTNVPTRISSLSEYQAFFGGPPTTTFVISADPAAGFRLGKSSHRFLLYHSLWFFFANGGAECYIVSIGDYSQGVNKADFDDETANKGISALRSEPAPTLLVIPDAVLLDKKGCGEVQQAMLKYCHNTGSCFAILDVPMSDAEIRQPANQNTVAEFRKNIGGNHLSWGAAYYPYLHTTVTAIDSVSFGNIAPDNLDLLTDLLIREAENLHKTKQVDDRRFHAMAAEYQKIPTTRTSDAEAVGRLHHTLLAISPLYRQIMDAVHREINTLPPSGGMAGLYTITDDTKGVFKSPANSNLALVVSPAAPITQAEQENMNLPPDGKAVNAIRTFPGLGVLVWGARTLDGNNAEWRYISVRRTMIFIEQSIRTGIQPFVFEPNDANTWANIKAVIGNFLFGLWKSGALAGAKPDDAFQVDAGLGLTMTALDIQEGNLHVIVKVALTRPAEFIAVLVSVKMHTNQ